MNNRIAADKITFLRPYEIFVFGSNLSGIHGAGAAKTALGWGAKWGCGVGAYGLTYAIPTKDYFLSKILSVDEIKPYVNGFIEWAQQYPDYTFLVTEIGCGLSKYTPENIAPLFEKAIETSNIYLPERFWNVLKKT